jgi:hypothetical protein
MEHAAKVIYSSLFIVILFCFLFAKISWQNWRTAITKY